MSPTTARRMTQAGLVLSAGEVVGKIATLVLVSVVARALGVAEFGIFSYGLGLGLLLSSFATLGLDQRLVQLSGHDPHSLSARLSSLLALRLLLSAVVIGGAATVLPVLYADTTRWQVLLVLVVAGCSDTFIEAFRAAASSRHVQSGPALVLVAQRLLALGLVVAALQAGIGLLGVALAYLAASLTGVALMATAARRRAGVRPRARHVSRGHALDFLRAVRVTGLNDLVSMALFRIDVVILAALAGDVAVGHYTAAYRLLETVLFISWSIGRVILPALADTSLGAAARSRTVTGAVVLVAALYLPYAALLLTRGPDLIELLFGDAFAASSVIYALALAPLFFGLAQVGVNSLLALRPDPAVLLASSSALVLNIVLNLALVPRYGAVAAAAVTTLSYGVQAIVVLVALARRIPPHGLTRSLGVSLAGATFAAVAMLLPLPPLLAMALGGLVYVAFWWLATRRWDRPTHDMVRAVLSPGAT